MTMLFWVLFVLWLALFNGLVFLFLKIIPNLGFFLLTPKWRSKMKRRKMSYRSNKRNFKKGLKTDTKNIARPQRGGIRL